MAYKYYSGLSAGRPVGRPAAGEIEINDNSAHQLGLSWGLGWASQKYASSDSFKQHS